MNVWKITCAPVLHRLAYLDALTKAFGPIPGARLFFKIGSIMRARTGLFSLHIPGLLQPIFVRAGTTDVDVFLDLFLRKEYKTDSLPQHRMIEERYKELINDGTRPLVIDCGANIGMTSVCFAKKYPEALILAIEPDINNLALLQKNCAPFQNIRVLHGAVWHSRSKISIENPDAEAWAFRVREADASANSQNAIQAYTIQSLIDLVGGDEILILKIDIEGAEDMVFKTEVPWMSNVLCLMIELHDWLFPGERRSAGLLRVLAKLEVDVIPSGQDLFIFQTPTAWQRRLSLPPTGPRHNQA